MSLQRRVERLEQASGFAPSPCPLCAECDRYARAVAALLPVEYEGEHGVFSYPSLCALCARRETRSVTLEVKVGAAFSAVMTAIAEGRYCEIRDALPEQQQWDDHWRPRFGDKWLEYQALSKEFESNVTELHLQYTPRAPYVCRVEGCRCVYGATQ